MYSRPIDFFCFDPIRIGNCKLPSWSKARFIFLIMDVVDRIRHYWKRLTFHSRGRRCWKLCVDLFPQSLVRFPLSYSFHVLTIHRHTSRFRGIKNTGTTISCKKISCYISVAESVGAVIFDATIFCIAFSRTWALYRQAKSAGIRGGFGHFFVRIGRPAGAF